MPDAQSEKAFVRTVLGDIDPADLGTTNYHEHLFQISPLLKGDELDDEALSLEEAEALRRSGFEAMVDATPLGLGGRPDALARISKSTGLKIIATTGRHREEHYPENHWVRSFSEKDLAKRFVSDLTIAMPLADGLAEQPKALLGDQSVRAGILKAGIGYWSISAFERQSLVALGKAHQETGAPVMIHLEFGTAAHEVLDVLNELSVPSTSVALAHMDRSLDHGLHVSLTERGAYLGYDGMARAKAQSDQELLELSKKVVEKVGASNILLGADVARRTRYIAYGGMPGLGYLALRYLPRLREEIGELQVETMLRENPARWLSWAN